MSFENENPFGDDGNDNPMGGGDGGDGDESFSVNIKNVNGDSNTFQVKKTDTIGDLVKKYREENQIKGNAKVILTYQGKILQEKNTIQSYEIDSDETLHALVRLQGGK